jgi:hypothetical protein
VRQGRYREAVQPLGESVRLAQEQSDAHGLAAQLEDLAGAAVGLRRFEDASVLMGGAEALLDKTGRTANAVFGEWRGEIVARVESELAHARLMECWQRGREMSQEDLVGYATAFVDSFA